MLCCIVFQEKERREKEARERMEKAEKQLKKGSDMLEVNMYKILNNFCSIDTMETNKKSF